MGNSRSLKGLCILAALSVAAACGSDTTEPEPDADPVIASASGNGQSAGVGEALADPIVVRVTQEGAPLSGTSVSWSVTAGGGSVSPTTSTTDASGNASTAWTLGPDPGANSLEASASGATGSPVTFSATAVAGAPPMSASVSVDEYAFDPDEATVAVGGTVTWTWIGDEAHNVTFTGAASPDQVDGTYSRTFTTAGAFPYQCTLHAGMNGTITVQ